MGTTPYVRRGRKYANGNHEWDSFIIVGSRHFDGIETDYAEKFRLSPDEARYVATELWKLAEEIDGKSKKTSVLAKVRKNTERIAKAAKAEALG